MRDITEESMSQCQFDDGLIEPGLSVEVMQLDQEEIKKDVLLLADTVDMKVEQEKFDMDDFLLNDQNEEFKAPTMTEVNQRGYMPSQSFSFNDPFDANKALMGDQSPAFLKRKSMWTVID